MTIPKITVIVPAYNHENYILQALESIVNQNYRPIEIIFIDDGSKDKTFEIGSNYLQNNSTNPICLKRQNKGAAYTINQALSISSGEYINILNSDDYFSYNRLNKCLEVAVRGGHDLIYTGVNFVDVNSEFAITDSYIESLIKVQEESLELPTIGFALLRNQLSISTGNLFFSRKLFSNVGYFNNYKYVHDWDYILRCLFYTEPLKLDDNLYNYRFHGENSFKSLADIAGYETTEVMRNFLWSVIQKYPLNPRAPCPQYWPGVFEYYVKKWNYHPYMPPKYRYPLDRARL